MKPCLYAAVLALLLDPAPVAPAAPAPDDEAAARKAAESCLEAVRRRDWKELAGHLDPDSLKGLKAKVAPALKRAAKGGEDLQSGFVLGLFGGADPEKLPALPPEEFFAAFTAATLTGGQRWPLAGTEPRVVGTVREGRGLAHVLYRARGKDRFAEGADDRGAGAVERLRLEGEVTRLGVLALRHGGGGWKALAPDELRHAADYVRAVEGEVALPGATPPRSGTPARRCAGCSPAS
jgi:hypothetical protein